MNKPLVIVAVAVFGTRLAWADDAKSNSSTTATFMVSGLHCPPCAGVVQSPLAKAKGVQSAKVDYASKLVRIKFDESQTSASQIADIVARTPHMMGGGMRYGGSLVLSVPTIGDKESGKVASDALSKLTGVAKANVFPGNHTLTVQFQAGAKVTSAEVIDALAKVGIEAKTF